MRAQGGRCIWASAAGRDSVRRRLQGPHFDRHQRDLLHTGPRPQAGQLTALPARQPQGAEGGGGGWGVAGCHPPAPHRARPPPAPHQKVCFAGKETPVTLSFTPSTISARSSLGFRPPLGGRSLGAPCRLQGLRGAPWTMAGWLQANCSEPSSENGDRRRSGPAARRQGGSARSFSRRLPPDGLRGSASSSAPLAASSAPCPPLHLSVHV